SLLSSMSGRDRGRLTPEERRRGEFVHRVFSLIECAEGGFEDHLGRAILQASDERSVAYDSEEVRETIRVMIGHPEIGPLFVSKPGRKISREQEFVDGEGRLFRMDRVILDPDRVVVVDWKTGREKDAEREHEAQMKDYFRILKGLYPERTIEGLLAYVDLKKVTRIH
ncbi:MAG: hypothetical protein EHM36_00765, partial [Deltaproteobacteria bacterium]